jgi:anti-anti-sigma factor
MGMDWRLRNDGKRLVGAPVGRVDEDSWQEFTKHVTAAAREAAVVGAPLIIDLSELEFMTSKGLRALTMAKNEAGGAVAISLAAPNETMRRILAISRYDLLFRVVDDVDSAG